MPRESFYSTYEICAGVFPAKIDAENYAKKLPQHPEVTVTIQAVPGGWTVFAEAESETTREIE